MPNWKSPGPALVQGFYAWLVDKRKDFNVTER